MPIGRGGGVAFADGEAEGEGLAVAPEAATPEAPVLDDGDAGEVLPATTLSDGWALG